MGENAQEFQNFSTNLVRVRIFFKYQEDIAGLGQLAHSLYL